MILYFIRHAQTAWNAQQRAQGRTDTRLDETGRKQAKLLLEALKHEAFGAVYTSPLARAVETAQGLSERSKAPLIQDERLMEFQFGGWEGLTFAQIEERFPKQLQKSRMHPFSYHIPGAEAPQDVLDRVKRFLEQFDPASGEVVAIVSHTIPLKVAIAHLMGLDYDNINALFLGNTGYTKVRLQPGGRPVVLCVNNMSHLERMRV